MNLSVVLATYNEENNLKNCLEAVKDVADEIIVVDGKSSDKTVEVAKSFGAKVVITDNQPIFHINKQKAIDLAGGLWVLQLDADEIVSQQLAEEITQVIQMTDDQIEQYENTLPNKKLFQKHQNILEQRDGPIGTKEGDYVAFFIPRANFFLGKYLKHGGIYPDGVIRLIKNGKAYLPAKDVHEQMVVEGKVGWLQYDLIHMADPTFKRYLERNNRYIDLMVQEFKRQKLPKNFFNLIQYLLIKPVSWFGLTFFRHKGILDGCQGLIFSFFSALRFSRAYLRYLNKL